MDDCHGLLKTVPHFKADPMAISIGDAVAASAMARALVASGVLVVAFSYPVVPRGTARIRTQISAAHSKADIDLALDAFVRVGRDLKVLDKVA